jgi:hypothetical protein
LNTIVEPESGVTILFNLVDNCEQCGQQNIVQSCFHQYCNNLIVFTRVSLKLPQGEVHDFSGEVQKFSGEVQNDHAGGPLLRFKNSFIV